MDKEAGRVYAANEAEYKIFVFDLKGNRLLSVERKTNPVPISEPEIEKIISSFRRKFSPQVKKLLKKNLPSSFCKIRKLLKAPFSNLFVFKLQDTTLMKFIFSTRGEITSGKSNLQKGYMAGKCLPTKYSQVLLKRRIRIFTVNMRWSISNSCSERDNPFS